MAEEVEAGPDEGTVWGSECWNEAGNVPLTEDHWFDDASEDVFESAACACGGGVWLTWRRGSARASRGSRGLRGSIEESPNISCKFIERVSSRVPI